VNPPVQEPAKSQVAPARYAPGVSVKGLIDSPRRASTYLPRHARYRPRGPPRASGAPSTSASSGWKKPPSGASWSWAQGWRLSRRGLAIKTRLTADEDWATDTIRRLDRIERRLNLVETP